MLAGKDEFRGGFPEPLITRKIRDSTLLRFPATGTALVAFNGGSRSEILGLYRLFLLTAPEWFSQGIRQNPSSLGSRLNLFCLAEVPL